MNIILAADRKWAIGKDNDLLIHLPGDLKYFKKMTTGKAVIMGRKTLESLPGGKPLPNRRNIILTRSKDFEVPGAEVFHSIEDVLQFIKSGNLESDETFIIGGAEIYKQMMPHCDKFYITKIDAELPADRYFVDLDQIEDLEITWRATAEEYQGTKYQYVLYEREKMADETTK